MLKVFLLLYCYQLKLTPNYRDRGGFMVRKGSFIVTAVALCVLALSVQSYAGDKEKAVEYVSKATAYLKANGEAAFIDAINNKGMFHDGEWYVWAVKTDFKDKTVTIAHITKPAVNAMSHNVKDAKGKLFVQEIVREAAKKNKGFTEYQWTHPKTKKVTPKVTYFEKVGDIIVMSGYYK